MKGYEMNMKGNSATLYRWDLLSGDTFNLDNFYGQLLLDSF